MKILERLGWKKESKKRSNSTGSSLRRDEEVPKNGRLALGVLAAVLIMVGLGTLNISLIRDPSVALKAFGPPVPSLPASPVESAETEKTDKPEYYVPPKVTFYDKLKTQEERPVLEPESDPRQQETLTGPTIASEEDIPATGAGRRVRSEAREDPRKPVRYAWRVKRPTREVKLPLAKRGKKTYTVQVGAFTEPGIADQWAKTWKEKGYQVRLKPVARPAEGIIYRLYLGEFEAGKDADRLVQRLRTKEGIQAFRLVLRN